MISIYRLLVAIIGVLPVKVCRKGRAPAPGIFDNGILDRPPGGTAVVRRCLEYFGTGLKIDKQVFTRADGDQGRGCEGRHCWKYVSL